MKGYYSLIQFCPDLSRQESINIGVLVYCPETGGLEALIGHSNERISKVFGSQDPVFLDRCRDSVAERLGLGFPTVEDLRGYIETRANAIQCTALRSLTLENITVDVCTLYTKLIGTGPTRYIAHQPSAVLPPMDSPR